jgi:hypothetical protein
MRFSPRLASLAGAFLLAALTVPGCSPNEGDSGKMDGAMDKGKMSGPKESGKMSGEDMDKGKMDGAMDK